MPFAAGFIESVVFFFVSAIAFLKLKKSFFKYDYIFAALFVTLAIGAVSYIDSNTAQPQFNTIYHEPNEPMGTAKGIFPGRVVWVHDPDATNENCNPNEYGDGWFLPQNNDQDVIDEMLSTGLKNLTGTTSNADAWDSIFIYHNRNNGKGDVGYNTGEKIFIKINIVSGWGGNYDPIDLSKVNNGSYGISETSPQIVLAVLRQLVDTVGIPQDNIYIGDPLRHIYKHLYDYWYLEFPDVHYMDHNGYTNLGREVLVASDSAKIEYSDRGKILRTNVWDSWRQGEDPVTEDHFYKIYDEAAYILDLPMLKGHKRAGMTAFAKNHFGSHTREDASHLHNGLVAPTEMPNVTRPGYGLYRVQVDIMGDEILGKKNLVYILDALWSADQEISYPKKFQMAPFNNDWMSSIFLSLDPVAIESVGYDFLRTEFTTDRPDLGDGAGTYVQMDGVDDYLHQAADLANWPDSILGADGQKYLFAGYDPENDGILLTSLGVHEHWDNPVDMQYSRNQGTGDGIELFTPTEILAAPTNLVATASGPNEVILNWDDNSITEDGYKIERKTDDSGNYSLLDSVGQNVTNFTNQSVQENMLYYYRVYAYNQQVVSEYSNEDTAQTPNITGINEQSVPRAYSFEQNFPNPFNPSTTLRFNLKTGSNVSLSVYDLTGKLVDIIINNEFKTVGTYEIKYNAEHLTSGVYFVLMEAGSFRSSLKIILMK